MTNPITPKAVELAAARLIEPRTSQDCVHGARLLRSLARELAEVKAERDAKARTLAVQVLITDKQQARAEKAETALTTARAQIVAAWKAGRDAAVSRYMDYDDWDCFGSARHAMANLKAPTDPADALAEHDRAVRADERAKCADIAVAAYDDRPRDRFGHPSQMDWDDGYSDGTRAAKAAILARGEREVGGE